MTRPAVCTTERRGLLLAVLASLLPGLVQAQVQGLPALVAKAKPSVVLVGTYSPTDSPRFQFRGTGFVVGDGLTVVTNAHVLPDPAQINGERQLMVQVWQGGRRWEARAAEQGAVNRGTDLALLRIKGNPAPVLSLGGEEPIAEGSEIALMGFPIGGALGFSHVIHKGIVSSLTQLVPPQAGARNLNAAAIRQLREAEITIYQLDAVAYPGNSGGPVFDVLSGQVIGVVNMVLTKSGREGALSAPSGITYAIPVARVLELLRP